MVLNSSKRKVLEITQSDLDDFLDHFCENYIQNAKLGQVQYDTDCVNNEEYAFIFTTDDEISEPNLLAIVSELNKQAKSDDFIIEYSHNEFSSFIYEYYFVITLNSDISDFNLIIS